MILISHDATRCSRQHSSKGSTRDLTKLLSTTEMWEARRSTGKWLSHRNVTPQNHRPNHGGFCLSATITSNYEITQNLA